ncbi:hypothetical protein TrispH2_005387 [Trichoplax sp. H2]|uniref:Uncharacterized protein n=1 Tax=Trichoplax adhaerens TaxID=10228 RepID=B3RVZ7_TRIAD|nr:predicted protein [Trichoplax adhaerens]EDV26087.1 predicted protein [Trichoplax adhaerens]RDD43095.1 hypothetical protein TrispH2_005387 [Trichoplax sp. H2]|eukprot:XP_002112120.1 predicted protein [Trichoplax adhaerens]
MVSPLPIFSQPLPKVNNQKQIIYQAKIDEAALSSFMMKHACCYSFFPVFGCLLLQPCRALCCARHEAHLQAAAIKVTLYDDDVEVRAESYMQCCTCYGAGAPPQPQNHIGFCWPSPKMIRIIPLDQITDVTISSTFQCDRICITSTVSARPKDLDYGIDIIGLQDTKDFKNAILKQQRLRKETANGRMLPPTDS